MGNIIVHGFVTNKLVTQGYHSGEAAEEAEAEVISPGFPPRRKRRYVLSPEILALIKTWLELE